MHSLVGGKWRCVFSDVYSCFTFTNHSVHTRDTVETRAIMQHRHLLSHLTDITVIGFSCRWFIPFILFYFYFEHILHNGSPWTYRSLWMPDSGEKVALNFVSNFSSWIWTSPMKSLKLQLNYRLLSLKFTSKLFHHILPSPGFVVPWHLSPCYHPGIWTCDQTIRVELLRFSRR